MSDVDGEWRVESESERGERMRLIALCCGKLVGKKCTDSEVEKAVFDMMCVTSVL